MFLILLAACTDAPPADTVQTDDTAPAGPVAAETVGGLRPSVVTVDCLPGDDDPADDVFPLPAEPAVMVQVIHVVRNTETGAWSMDTFTPERVESGGGIATFCGGESREEVGQSHLVWWQVAQ